MKQLTYLVFAGFTVLLMACGGEPTADFTMNPSGDLAPVTVEFTNTSKSADRYMWDFGDGNTSEAEAPSHTYDYWGDYTITLRAIKGNKENITTQQISIKEPPRRKVLIETDYGNMTVELSNLTPLHRDNFVKLASEGYFDGLLFHRVISGFMIQGGDPESRNAPPTKKLGMGSPGYRVPAEFRRGMYHYKGAIAAARDGNPQKASNGSQYYLVQGGGPITDAGRLTSMAASRGFSYTADEIAYYQKVGGRPDLDNNYTVFGYVIEGFDVIDKIAAVPKNAADRPLEDVKMKVSVLE